MFQFPAPDDDLPAVAEPPPTLDPNRRFDLVIESRGGNKFRFERISYTQVLERIEWAEPYGFKMVYFEEVT